MTTENNQLTVSKIIFTIIYLLIFPALVLLLAGDRWWVEGWTFGIYVE